MPLKHDGRALFGHGSRSPQRAVHRFFLADFIILPTPRSKVRYTITSSTLSEYAGNVP